MAELVNVARKIYGTNSFKNVINTEFTEFVPKDSPVSIQQLTNVEEFFKMYDALFYDIPATDENNSHLELINRSSDYIGVSLSELEEEIKNLREENVSLKNQIVTLTQNNI